MECSVYNCIAYMVRELLNVVDGCFFQNYRAISKNTVVLNNRILYKKFPELMDSNGNIQKIVMPNYIRKELSHKLHQFTDSCIKENNLMLLAQMLGKLDLALKDEVASVKYDNFNFEGLNSNAKQLDIQILPRCISSWGHDNKDKNNSHM